METLEELKEYVANKIFYNFKPADIFAHIDPSYTETATPLYIELTQLFYNTEAYPDGSPITNLWQLTEPQWKGKIMMQNPLDNLAWGNGGALFQGLLIQLLVGLVGVVDAGTLLPLRQIAGGRILGLGLAGVAGGLGSRARTGWRLMSTPVCPPVRRPWSPSG